MRSNTSLLGRDLLGIALRLDILTIILKIIFNYNLFPCSPCVPWIKKDRWELCDIKGRDDENENL